jgi:hypothetical protein
MAFAMLTKRATGPRADRKLVSGTHFARTGLPVLTAEMCT